MRKFSDVVGQEQIKAYFHNAIITGNLAHAYIINGEDGTGKEFIARIVASILQCEKGGSEPCGECHSCKQASSSNHPDIITITHEKPKSIGVEDIRRQLNEDVGIKPYQSEHKIYLIPEGEKLTKQAQNALLKTLEEPPGYVVIFILTANLQEILPTITSRSVVLHMKPVRDQEIMDYLMNKLEVPDYQAKLCVSFARGNIGRAKLLATNEEFDKIREETIFLMRHISDLEIKEIGTAIKKLNEHQLALTDSLDVIAVWFRDLLLYKATNDVNMLIFRDEIQAIKKAVQLSDYEGLEKILQAIEKAKERIRANANLDLTMELLMLTIKENS